MICENHVSKFHPLLEKWVKLLLTKITDTWYTGDSIQPEVKLQIHKTSMIKWNISMNCSTRQNAHFLLWLRPWKTAPFSEWKDRRLHWTNNPSMIKYFCIIQMDGYHFNHFPCVHILASFYSSLCHKTSNQNILLFFNGYNDLWSMLYKTYNPSFSNCPLTPNNLDFPWIIFSLLSKMNYNMALLALFVFTKIDKICEYYFKL